VNAPVINPMFKIPPTLCLLGVLLWLVSVIAIAQPADAVGPVVSGSNFSYFYQYPQAQERLIEPSSDLMAEQPPVLNAGWRRQRVNLWHTESRDHYLSESAQLSGSAHRLSYQAAYYHAGDWRNGIATSYSDGYNSPAAYHHLKSWQGSVSYALTRRHSLGVSVQSATQQAMADPAHPQADSRETATIYYEGQLGEFFSEASYMAASYGVPERYSLDEQKPSSIKNQRISAKVGYNVGPWAIYLDASAAEPEHHSRSRNSVRALAPGVRYDYNSGWINVEYLNQNGYIDRNGRINEGVFEALYVSLGFYL